MRRRMFVAGTVALPDAPLAAEAPQAPRVHRAGHVFGARFTSSYVTSDAYLLTVIAYIAMNPVGAGLCRRPEDWTFSSYRALLGREPSGFLELKSLLRLYAFDPDEAGRRIEEFVCPDGLAP